MKKEKRKVNLVGQNTLTVSLPTKWVKENNIEKGDEVELLIDEKELVISTKIKVREKSTKIKILKGNEWYINQKIRNLYTSGYDEIYVEFQDQESLLKIYEGVEKLMGYEIIEQNNNSCLIKSIANGMEENFDIILRKIFFLTSELFNKLIHNLENNNNKDLAIFMNLHYNIYKFCVFCRRILNKTNNHDSQKKFALQTIITRNGMISANLSYIYKYLSSKNNITIKLETIKYISNVKDHYDLFSKILFSKKIDELNKLNMNREQLINQDMVALLENNKGIDNVIVHYIAEITRIISSSGGSIINYLIED